MRSGPVVLAVLLLVGCAAPPPPDGPTEAEILEQLDRQSAQWWETVAPDEPMPRVDPVRVVDDYSEQWAAVRDCLAVLEFEGLDIDDSGGWTFTASDPETVGIFERAQWVCTAKYPVDPGSPDHAFTLTEEQARYLWDYYATRLIPCIEAHGYPLAPLPARDEYLSERWWSPYFALSQTPIGPRELATLDAECPPPPIPVQRPY
jgi:hypothetical protein